MNSDQEQLKLIAASVVKGMARKSAALAICAALALVLYDAADGLAPRWWFPAASILFGAALGVLNFRWLAETVEKVYVRGGMTSAGANAAGIFLTILKLAAIFVVLFIVIAWDLVHLPGLVGGLTASFAAILWQGLAVMQLGKKV